VHIVLIVEMVTRKDYKEKVRVTPVKNAGRCDENRCMATCLPDIHA